MQITFEKLIKVAPFDQETKQKILDQLPSLSTDQKFQLSATAWEMIATLYQAKLKQKFDTLLLEVQQGKRQYNKNDFVEAQVAQYHELANQFEFSEKEEGLKEIRQELDKYIKPPQV